MVGSYLCAANGSRAALSNELRSASAPGQEFRWSCRWAATDEPPSTVWDIGACFVCLRLHHQLVSSTLPAVGHALLRLPLALLFSPAVGPLFSVFLTRCGSALSPCGCSFQLPSQSCIALFWTSITDLWLLFSGSSNLPARSCSLSLLASRKCSSLVLLQAA